jgi:hypothetical protein
MIPIKFYFIPILVALCVLLGGSGMAAEINYEGTLSNVALHIADLKKEFPQLTEFSPIKNADLKNLRILYEFRTHQAQHRAGWTSGVPNPNDDGVWFYIDFHDHNSTAQIHTQPMAQKMCLGNKIALLLILEGKHTRKIANAILRILENNGVKLCESE